MDLSALVHNGVALAAGLVDSLMVAVQHEAVTGRDSYGNATYGAAVTRKAALTVKNQKVTDANGADVVSRCQLLFPASIAVKDSDRITLPDGKTPPIAAVEYMSDSSGQPFAVQVYF